MRFRIALLGVLLALGGCATSLHTHSSLLSYTPAVRRMSDADNILFKDLVNATGGVGFADTTLYPKAKRHELTRIQIIAPYGTGADGKELWTVNHGNGKAVTYEVIMVPDGRGGTNFEVKLRKTKARASAPPGCPPHVNGFKSGKATAAHVKQCLGTPASENHNPDGRFVYLYQYRYKRHKVIMTFLFDSSGKLIRIRGFEDTRKNSDTPR